MQVRDQWIHIISIWRNSIFKFYDLRSILSLNNSVVLIHISNVQEIGSLNFLWAYSFVPLPKSFITKKALIKTIKFEKKHFIFKI